MIKFCLTAGIVLLIISAVMLIFQFKVPKEYNDLYETIMGGIGIAGTFLLAWFLPCIIG